MTMERKFKTNINCSGCIAKVTPYLNETEGIKQWSVDTNNPNKILSIEMDSLSEEEIKNVVTKAGFKIEELNN
jgi:copper chaperone